MTNIRERTEQLHERLLQLGERKAQYDERKELDDFRALEIEPRVTRLQRIKATRGVFGNREIACEPSAIPIALQTAVGDLRKRFGRAPVRATLVAPKVWPVLMPALDACIAAAEKAVLDSWSSYCLAQAPADDPMTLKQDPAISPHPENAPVLRDYEGVHKLLARSSSSVPRIVEEVDEFADRSRRAHALLGRLRRDLAPPQQSVPPDVQRFLRAAKVGPVELDMLTAEILKWLKAGNRQGEFEVRRKGP